MTGFDETVPPPDASEPDADATAQPEEQEELAVSTPNAGAMLTEDEPNRKD